MEAIEAIGGRTLPRQTGTKVTAASRTSSEAELVRRAQGGDMAAFEVLYRQSVGPVFAVCRRIGGSEPLAEELTQDVFLRAWRKLAMFRGESAFSTWLIRLAVNEAISGARRQRRWSARFTLGNDLEKLAGASDGPSPGLRFDLERAIQALPAGARVVFVLHDVHGYAHEEIARFTGTAVGTCKAQLHRARSLLREVLSR